MKLFYFFFPFLVFNYSYYSVATFSASSVTVARTGGGKMNVDLANGHLSTSTSENVGMIALILLTKIVIDFLIVGVYGEEKKHLLKYRLCSVHEMDITQPSKRSISSPQVLACINFHGNDSDDVHFFEFFVNGKPLLCFAARRKQKWSTDPRNSAWSNDDSKFGQKMLERMGWSKGKGLGRSEQGATEHVKVKVKNNCHGLGALGSQEDNWIAHQDDFNDLLAQLNNCHGQNSSSSNAEERKGFSLEEKSKGSKKRVHYMKFARGKDLSCRSATDLDCIFGKRPKSGADPQQEGSSSGDSPQLDSDSGAKTVTSTLTTQEYFAQRMARLKMARSQVAADVHESEEPKKKKKKKEEEEDAAKENLTEGQDSEDQKKKKKKKKTKHTVEMPTAETALEPGEKSSEDRELVVRNKSKKLKKNKSHLPQYWGKVGGVASTGQSK
ncbi:PIN2/TERF1-interacting telomerase inhibitor 1 isoform X1 [Syngnathoides biaculeatus]|uniref:PIN2/TERF1-interacting telomerase inhibitor 1 isoform X1 n=1 Tax=Syngnathoides biaculeatus TaxID=300417 RepID=UPI002ADDF17B|nr:PIN2/TERF1-interacting telomerase inhibitor 1 isoform X1 [Syngnathoides biaculeatus]